MCIRKWLPRRVKMTGPYLILVTVALSRIITNLLQVSSGSHVNRYSVESLLRLGEVGSIPGCGV